MNPFEKEIQKNIPTAMPQSSEQREDAGLQAEKIIVDALNMFGIPSELGSSYDDNELKIDIWMQFPGLIPVGLQIKFTENTEREKKTIQFIESRGFREIKRPNPKSQTDLGKYSGETFHFHSIRPQWELKQLFEQAKKMKLTPAEALLAKGGPATLRNIFLDISKETAQFENHATGNDVKQKIMGTLQGLSGK